MSGIYKLVLIGTPNAGKTTCFNMLGNQHNNVSNFAGTTVETTKLIIQDLFNHKYELIDIPGIYGSAINLSDEQVAWKEILIQKTVKKTRFIQIIDSEKLEQSLLLTLSFIEKGIYPLCIINKKSAHKIDTKIREKIETILGLPVLITTIDNANFKNIFWKFFHKNNQNIQIKNLNVIKKLTRSHLAKLKFIKDQIKIKSYQSLHQKVSKKLDNIFLNKWLGIPIFLGIMYLIFQATFTLGGIPMTWIDQGIVIFQNYLVQVLPNNLWSDLLINGILSGIGGIIIFLPNILILFFLLNFLQQSGYLARVAYLLDLFFQKFGVTGKASVPLLIGFGCNVPAIMATRNMQSQKEKIITSMMILFMSCGARLPVLTILIAAFIPKNYQSFTLFIIYLFGILIAFLTGLIFNKAIPAKTKGWILEMPSYAFPKFKNLIKIVWIKLYYFVVKVGKILLPLSIIFWMLFSFPQEEVKNSGIEKSYGAVIGKTIQPIFEPLNFDWRLTTALLSGLAAKEIMVVTLSEVYNLDNPDNKAGLIKSLQQNLDFPTAMALLVFTLLYTPCLAVIGTLKIEFGIKWALIGILYPSIISWIFSLIMYNICKII
jgi:ferrous iron transport protein B